MVALMNSRAEPHPCDKTVADRSRLISEGHSIEEIEIELPFIYFYNNDNNFFL